MIRENNDSSDFNSNMPDLPPELIGLGEEILQCETPEKEDIVKFGLRLEKTLAHLKNAKIKSGILDLLKVSLKLLQELYQESVNHA